MKSWVRKSFAVGVLAAGALLVSGGGAQAQSGVTTTGGAAGDGVLTGNVVQVPVTVVAPLQLCNNNVAAGVIAVAVDALGSKACVQGDTGVSNTEAYGLGEASGVTTTGGATGNGVAAGNVIQVPITAVVPIQACNNNVAAGLVAVAVDALNSKACVQDDTGVSNSDHGMMSKSRKASKKETPVSRVGNMIDYVKDNNNVNKKGHAVKKGTEATDAAGAVTSLDSVTGLLGTATDALQLASVTPNMDLG